jgi:hypothetical protein
MAAFEKDEPLLEEKASGLQVSGKPVDLMPVA